MHNALLIAAAAAAISCRFLAEMAWRNGARVSAVLAGLVSLVCVCLFAMWTLAPASLPYP